jgi:hypothetical protein
MLNPQDLAARILREILAHPDRHDQRVWMKGLDHLRPEQALPCGTTLCVAGHAAHLSGYTLHRQGTGKGPVDAIADGTRLPVKKAAEQLLGLSDADTLRLFDSQLPAGQARAALAQLAVGATRIDWQSIQ